MKKTLILVILLFLFLAGSAKAAITSNLFYGIKDSSQVRELQQFLIQKGLLSGKATGNYFTLTVNAVKAYQISKNITATGYFGPLTRNSVNAELAAAPGQNQIAAPAAAGAAVEQTVSVTAPAAGAILIKGQTYAISWSSSGLPLNSTATIRIFDSESVVSASAAPAQIIAKNVPTVSGSFLWEVPDSISEGKYIISIYYGAGQVYYFANSPVFTIRNLSPKISITAPLQGSNLVRGRVYDITWSAQDMPAASTLNISYNLPGTQRFISIAENILVSAGKFSWTIPDFLPGQYKILIQASNGNFAESAIFNIKDPEPKITITSPGGGAILLKGKSYPISWTFQDIPPSTPIIIYLCYSMSTFALTTSHIAWAYTENPPISANSISWTVPDQSNIFASYYVIYATTLDGTIRAMSSPFYIKIPGTL